MHLYQDLVSVGAVLTFACIVAFFLVRRQQSRRSRRWEGVLVVAALIGAITAVFGFVNG